jgi:hypothetical protein
MGEIFGAAGQIAGSAIQASAMKDATQMQIDALQKNRDFVFQNLDPATINQQALAASQQQAQNRLALQGQIDPALLAQRYAAEGKLAEGTNALGTGAAQDVAKTAADQAIAGTKQTTDAKSALIDAALANLKAGATLPPDVQAELVQTGLEKTGQMSQSASSQGFGGQILRKVLGTAGIQLQQQRQQTAAALAGQAQNLEQSRAGILTNLFPNLSSLQLNTLQGSENALNTSNNMLPQAGLSGNDIANVWLQRVGATSNINNQAAQVAATGAVNQANAWAPAIGAGATAIGSAATSPAASSLWNTISGGGSDLVY